MWWWITFHLVGPIVIPANAFRLFWWTICIFRSRSRSFPSLISRRPSVSCLVASSNSRSRATSAISVRMIRHYIPNSISMIRRQLSGPPVFGPWPPPSTWPRLCSSPSRIHEAALQRLRHPDRASLISTIRWPEHVEPRLYLDVLLY